MARLLDFCLHRSGILGICIIFQLFTFASTKISFPDTRDPLVVTLYEKEKSRKTLADLACMDGNNSVVVSLNRTSISSPCSSCFTVLPNCSGIAERYCLDYLPNVGTLSYVVTPIYYIDVICASSTDNVHKTIEVRLTVNTPPRFDPDVSFYSITVSKTRSLNANDLIFEVNATDYDNDVINYSMTTNPMSNSFEIGPIDGMIRATQSLEVECRNFIVFKVNISDGINRVVGPLTIQATLLGRNVAPDITNLDVTLQLPEDIPVGRIIVTLNTTDDGPSTILRYNLLASPPSNLYLFKLQNTSLTLNSSLDFENAAARTTNLTVVVNDDYCSSPTHYIVVIVTDVNEAPKIFPQNATFTVNEGKISIDPNWNVIDPDLVDTKSYTLIGTNNRFAIDRDSGKITSVIEYDVDPPASMPPNVTLTVKVTDKGALTDTTTVTIIIQDINDNIPDIANGSLVFPVDLCTASGGDFLGTMVCTDKDSSFRYNNVVYFSAFAAGITVTSDGKLYLNRPPAPGQTLTSEVICYDRGEFPSPLQSISKYVTLIAKECITTTTRATTPTTTVPTTTPTTTTATTTPKTTSPPSTANQRTWIDEDLWWIILAALLCTFLLSCFAFVSCRYCTRSGGRGTASSPKPTQVSPPVNAMVPVTPVRPPSTFTAQISSLSPYPAVVGPRDADEFSFWRARAT